MRLLGLHPEWAIFKDIWRDLIWGENGEKHGEKDVFKINDDDDDDDDDDDCISMFALCV